MGGDSGVTSTLVKDTSLIDSAPDARANRAGAAAGTAPPAASTGRACGNRRRGSGSGTHRFRRKLRKRVRPAAAPKPATTLPQNHTGTGKALSPAQQLKLAEKQQAQLKKNAGGAGQEQKKQQDEEQAKKDKKNKKDDRPGSRATDAAAPAARRADKQ